MKIKKTRFGKSLVVSRKNQKKCDVLDVMVGLRCGFGKIKSSGFSLLEIMLVLSIATGLMLLAFMLNKSRVSSLQSDDASRQVITLEKTIDRLRNASLNYQFLGGSGLSAEVIGSIIPKQLLDSEGKLSHALGDIDIRAVQLSNPYDAYAITLNGASPDFCSKLISKVYDSFGQVRVGSALESTEVVWLKSEPFSVSRVSEGCANLSGDKVIQFISAPQIKYGQQASSNSLSSAPIVQVQFMSPSTVTAGAMTSAPTIGWQTPVATTLGMFSETASGYGQTVVDESVQPPPLADKSCIKTSLTWNAQLLDGTSHTCNGESVISIDGSHIFVQNMASGKLGGAHYECAAGSWKLTTGTCAPVGCEAKVVTWGAGCSGAVGNAQSQQVQNVANQNVAYTGQADFVCNGGNFAYVSGPCNAVPQPPAEKVIYVTQQFKDGKIRYFEYENDMGGWYSATEPTSALDSCAKGSAGTSGYGPCQTQANDITGFTVFTAKGSFNVKNGNARIFGDGSGTQFSIDQYKDAAKTQLYEYEYFCNSPFTAHGSNMDMIKYGAYTIGTCTKKSQSNISVCTSERVYWGGATDRCSAMATDDNSSVINDITGFTGDAQVRCNQTTKKFETFNTTCLNDGPGGGSKVDGVCGGANGVASAGMPSAQLCTKGTPTGVASGANWSWQCQGQGSGALTAACTAPKSASGGECGSANGKTLTVEPVMAALCSKGTHQYIEPQYKIPVSSLTATATGWNWSCYGSAGGGNASCSAQKGEVPPQKPVTMVQVENRKSYGGINPAATIFNMYALSDWETKSYPIMIVMHGGGWMEGGGNLGDFDLWARDFAQKGYKVFDISYTGGAIGKPAYQLPAAMKDVETFIQYIKSNRAKYNISPTDPVSIIGGSAGGHLAMYNAAYGSTNYKCVINVAGPIDVRGTIMAAERYPTDKTGIPEGFTDWLVRDIRDAAAPTIAQQNQANIDPTKIKAQKFYQIYSERDNIVLNSINMDRVNALLGARVTGNLVVPYEAPYIDGGHNLGSVEGMLGLLSQLGVANACK